MQNYKIYIEDALRMINRIEKFKDKSLKEVQNWDATLMRLQVIGESVKKIPKDVKKSMSSMDWEKFENLRNFISHVYTQVFPKIILDIIDNEIPKLKLGLLQLKGNVK
ncbi:MAG: HepT-like ribonuclease domain-containing protein [archaeon]